MTELIDTPLRHPLGGTISAYLRPIGDPAPGIPVQLELGAGRLAISGESVGDLGTWDLAVVGVSEGEEGMVLTVDGEQLLVTFDDEAHRGVLLDAFRERPWWATVLPIIGGLAIAAMIWLFAA